MQNFFGCLRVNLSRLKSMFNGRPNFATVFNWGIIEIAQEKIFTMKIINHKNTSLVVFSMNILPNLLTFVKKICITFWLFIPLHYYSSCIKHPADCDITGTHISQIGMIYDKRAFTVLAS
jgi:hypothetical protein